MMSGQSLDLHYSHFCFFGVVVEECAITALKHVAFDHQLFAIFLFDLPSGCFVANWVNLEEPFLMDDQDRSHFVAHTCKEGQLGPICLDLHSCLDEKVNFLNSWTFQFQNTELFFEADIDSEVGSVEAKPLVWTFELFIIHVVILANLANLFQVLFVVPFIQLPDSEDIRVGEILARDDQPGFVEISFAAIHDQFMHQHVGGKLTFLEYSILFEENHLIVFTDHYENSLFCLDHPFGIDFFLEKVDSEGGLFEQKFNIVVVYPLLGQYHNVPTTSWNNVDSLNFWQLNGLKHFQLLRGIGDNECFPFSDKEEVLLAKGGEEQVFLSLGEAEFFGWTRILFLLQTCLIEFVYRVHFSKYNEMTSSLLISVTRPTSTKLK